MKKIFSIAAVAALALGLAACKTELSSEQRGVAEHGALIFANGAGGQFTSCSGLDSDGDGYVTCSVKIPQTNPESNSRRLEMTEILCAYKGSAGCKIKR